MKSKIISLAFCSLLAPAVSLAAPQCGVLIDNINTTNREVKINLIDLKTDAPVGGTWGYTLATDNQFELTKSAFEGKKTVCIEWTTVANKNTVSALYFDKLEDSSSKS